MKNVMGTLGFRFGMHLKVKIIIFTDYITVNYQKCHVAISRSFLIGIK